MQNPYIQSQPLSTMKQVKRYNGNTFGVYPEQKVKEFSKNTISHKILHDNRLSVHRTTTELYNLLIDITSSVSQYSSDTSCSTICNNDNRSNANNCLENYKNGTTILYHCSICSDNYKVNVTHKHSSDVKWWQYTEKLEEIQFPRVQHKYQNKVTEGKQSVFDKHNKALEESENEFNAPAKKAITENTYVPDINKINFTINDITEEIITLTEKKVKHILSMLIFDLLVGHYFLNHCFVCLKKKAANHVADFKEKLRSLFYYLRNIKELFCNHDFSLLQKIQELKKMINTWTQVFNNIKVSDLNGKCKYNDSNPLLVIANELCEIKEILLLCTGNVNKSDGVEDKLKTVAQLSEIISAPTLPLHLTPPPLTPPPPPPPPPPPLPQLQNPFNSVEKITTNKKKTADSSPVRPAITVEDLKSVQLRKTPRRIKRDESEENKSLNFFNNKESKEVKNLPLNMPKSRKSKMDTNKAKTLRY